MDIRFYIGIGKENAVTRSKLCELTGLHDRKVRKLIADARKEGTTILNDQDGQGYFISDDLYELRRQFNANRSRALSILRQQKYLRQKIQDAENKDQLKLEEGRNYGN